MKTAEKIAIQNNKKKICVISGVGVRNYYRKLGYKLEDGYMTKKLYLKNKYIVTTEIYVIIFSILSLIIKKLITIYY